MHVYSRRGPFSGPQLRAHLTALSKRAGFQSAAEAVNDSGFADSVRMVLREWGVGTRGAELVPLDAFHAELRKLAPRLAVLDQVHIEDDALDVRKTAEMVWELIDSMCLVTKDGQTVRNKLVSASKALHHLLPALVFPIDREYTQTFFGWHNPEFQYNPRGCFEVIFFALAEIARKVRPTQFVGEGWMSGPTKILDNSVVGYCIGRGLESESTRQQRRDRAMVKRAKELGIWDALKAQVETKKRD